MTPSAQQFLWLEAEITQGETHCVSAKSLWECGESTPRSRQRQNHNIDSKDKQPALSHLGEFSLKQSYPRAFPHVSRGGQINPEQTLASQLSCVLPTMTTPSFY